MATRTSVGSGKWSVAATWDTGVPADGDTFIVAAGHTVDFDVDTSAYATGLIPTTSGVLRAYPYLSVSADGNATLGDVTGITGLTLPFMTVSSTVRAIYASIVDDGGGAWHVDLYKEVGRTTKIAHTGNIAGDGAAALTADNSSGVGGSITIANFASIAADADIVLSGFYYLKQGGNVTFGASGAREFQVGSAGTAYPVCCQFTLDSNGANQIYNPYKVLWYHSEPTVRWVKLSTTEAAGQTELSVDVDVTGEGDHWRAGAEVAIVRVQANSAAQVEYRTIASGGVAAGTITVTSGLTNEKPAGSYVVLLTRNVRVIGAVGASYVYGNSMGSGSVFGGEWRPASGYYTIVNVGNVPVMSGVYCGGAAGYNGSLILSGIQVGSMLNGVSNGEVTSTGAIFGAATAWYNSSSISFFGLAAGCGDTFSTIRGGVIGGVVDGSSRALSGCSVKCLNTVFRSGYQIVTASTDVSMYGCVFGSPTAVVVSWASKYSFVRSFDYNGTIGDTRAWTAGGTMTPETVTVPAGKTSCHKFTYTSASYWTRMDWDLWVRAGQKLTIPVWAKHDAAGLSGDQLLRWELIDPASDPIFNSGTALDSFTAVDGTDWQTGTLTYTAAKDGQLILRCSAKRGSGNSCALAEFAGGAHSPIGSPIIKGLGAL